MLRAEDFLTTNRGQIKTLLSEDAELLEDLTREAFDVSHGWFYQFLLTFLTNLDFTEDEAKWHYFRLLEHRFVLSESMKRDVGIRVATLDYFQHVVPRLKNPRIVEIQIFKELLKLSKKDTKTGCFNARFFHDFTLRELRRAERTRGSVSILLLDIDHFKQINDVHGHLMGDKVIKEFADVFKANARKEDIAARFGGDEFALLMPQTGRIGARSIAERLRDRVEAHFRSLGEGHLPIEVTFSGGIATFPLDASDYEGLVQAADMALYHSKQTGRSRIFDKLEQAYLLQGLPGEERRIHRRHALKKAVPVGIDADFTRGSLSDLQSKIVDISQGGVLLECSAHLTSAFQGTAIQIRLDPKLGLPLEPQFPASIVRDVVEAGYLKFYLGLRFNHDLDPGSWAALEQTGLIETESKDRNPEIPGS